MKISDYFHGYRIVSVTKSEYARDDLIQDGIDFLYVDGKSVILYPERISLCADEKVVLFFQELCDYDVLEIWPDGSLHMVYSCTSSENDFYVTGKCNSNCVMCPSSDASRRHCNDADVDKLIELAKHIPTDARHLTITGGEPFMAGERIFEFFSFLQSKYDKTEFLILTNGRCFAIKKYIDALLKNIPAGSTLGIPLHGSTPKNHDKITQAEGSFVQTMTGLKRLLAGHIRVEIRMVVCKLNVDDFLAMANLIVKELRGISHVSIMAAEMTGSAWKNRDRVWIPYREAFDKIEEAVRFLILNGIDVMLYNFPLCTVKKDYWQLCKKSISSYKVRYASVCEQCKYKDGCGGVFAGTMISEKDDLRAL